MNRMAKTSPIENAGTHCAPSSRAASMPQIAAPAVLAMVFNTKMADVGLAMSSFIAMNRSALSARSPSALSASRALMRVE